MLPTRPPAPPPLRRPWRGAAALAALVGGLTWAGWGCGPSPEAVAADREEIQRTLESYLPKLARAYATGDVELLRGIAVEKEMARVAKIVGELAEQGRVLKPELREITVEDLTLWSHNNAYVTTLEIWTVRSHVLGTDQLISEAPDQPHRVKYQLKRRDEGWEILYREVEQTFS